MDVGVAEEIPLRQKCALSAARPQLFKCKLKVKIGWKFLSLLIPLLFRHPKFSRVDLLTYICLRQGVMYGDVSSPS